MYISDNKRTTTLTPTVLPGEPAIRVIKIAVHEKDQLHVAYFTEDDFSRQMMLVILRQKPAYNLMKFTVLLLPWLLFIWTFFYG
jgi:hypothetical protein